MYEAYFGLSEQPFRISPDNRFNVDVGPQRAAVEALLRGLDRGDAFMFLEGDFGTGKTLAARRLLAEAATRQHVVAELSGLHAEGDAMLERIAKAFSVETFDLTRPLGSLVDFFGQLGRAGRHALLVVDEAQSLGLDAMRRLRKLTDVMHGGRGVLQVCLVGRALPELALRELARVGRPLEIGALAQVGAFDVSETDAYIRARLVRAGWQGRPSLEPGVTAEIHARCQGNAARINRLCGHLMLRLFLQQGEALTVELVQAVDDQLHVELGYQRAAAGDDAPAAAREPVVEPTQPGLLAGVAPGESAATTVDLLLPDEMEAPTSQASPEPARDTRPVPTPAMPPAAPAASTRPTPAPPPAVVPVAAPGGAVPGEDAPTYELLPELLTLFPDDDRPLSKPFELDGAGAAAGADAPGTGAGAGPAADAPAVTRARGRRRLAGTAAVVLALAAGGTVAWQYFDTPPDNGDAAALPEGPRAALEPAAVPSTAASTPMIAASATSAVSTLASTAPASGSASAAVVAASSARLVAAVPALVAPAASASPAASVPSVNPSTRPFAKPVATAASVPTRVTVAPVASAPARLPFRRPTAVVEARTPAPLPPSSAAFAGRSKPLDESPEAVALRGAAWRRAHGQPETAPAPAPVAEASASRPCAAEHIASGLCGNGASAPASRPHRPGSRPTSRTPPP